MGGLLPLEEAVMFSPASNGMAAGRVLRAI